MTAPAAAHADRPAFDFKEAKAALTSSSTAGRTAQLRSVEEKLAHNSESLPPRAWCSPFRD